MKKKIIRFLLIIFLGLLLISLSKDFIITSIASTVVTKVTGAKTHIGWVSLSFLRQSLTIKNLKIYNPQSFSNEILLDMPKFHGSLDIGALLGGKLKMPSVELDLKQVLLERNAQGKLNIDALKVSEESPRGKKPNQQMPFQIDVLDLDIGKVISKEYSASGASPAVRVFDVEIHKSYKNITSAEQLIMLILSESLKTAGIRSAAIYGAALLTGVGIVPIAAASILTTKDSVQRDFNMPAEVLYQKTLKVLKRLGNIAKEDKDGYAITATVNGANVSVKISHLQTNKSQAVISARKYFLPKREIAGGVLYELTNEK